MLRALSLATLLTCAAHAAAACTMPADVDAKASALVASVNAARQANGVPPLAYQPLLGQAAMTHACDMAVNGITGHRGSDGSNSQARVRAAGYRDCTVAENVGWGVSDGQRVVGMWMGSASHRSNMLHPGMTEMGVGITEGAAGPNWVLVVAQRC